MRSLPMRSPSGPNRICIAPYATAKPVITHEALAIPTSNSRARRGSNASVTRIEAELANAPRARRTMVRFKPASVALPPGRALR